jgi:hypothetical protein
MPNVIHLKLAEEVVPTIAAMLDKYEALREAMLRRDKTMAELGVALVRDALVVAEPTDGDGSTAFDISDLMALRRAFYVMVFLPRTPGYSPESPPHPASTGLGLRDEPNGFSFDLPSGPRLTLTTGLARQLICYLVPQLCASADDDSSRWARASIHPWEELLIAPRGSVPVVTADQPQQSAVAQEPTPVQDTEQPRRPVEKSCPFCHANVTQTPCPSCGTAFIAEAPRHWAALDDLITPVSARDIAEADALEVQEIDDMSDRGQLE